MARQTKRSQQVTLQLQRYEKDIKSIRGEVTEARELHQNISGKRNLFDGAAGQWYSPWSCDWSYFCG